MRGRDLEHMPTRVGPVAGFRLTSPGGVLFLLPQQQSKGRGEEWGDEAGSLELFAEKG